MFQISNRNRPNKSFKEGDTVANDKKRCCQEKGEKTVEKITHTDNKKLVKQVSTHQKNTISIKQITVVTKTLNFSQHRSKSLKREFKKWIFVYTQSRVHFTPSRSVINFQDNKKQWYPLTNPKNREPNYDIVRLIFTPTLQKKRGKIQKFKQNRQNLLDHTHYSYLIVTGRTEAQLSRNLR